MGINLVKLKNTPKARLNMNINKLNLIQVFFYVLLIVSTPADAAPAPVQGQYVLTSGNTGAFKYTPLRAIIQYGSEGNFVICGKSYPGSMYAIRYGQYAGGVGMVWYYGTSGIMAGNAVVQRQADLTACPNISLLITPTSCSVGSITFTARNGTPIDSGMLTVGFR
jgi:hypothetical protein